MCSAVLRIAESFLLHSDKFPRIYFEQTKMAHREIAENIAAAAKATGKDYIIVSRSDSTLRGHYPLETEVLRETLEAAGEPVPDGEVLCPFFKRGREIYD